MKRKITVLPILLFSLLINTLIVSGEPIIYSISPENGARLDYNPVLIINISNDRSMDIFWYFKESESDKWEQIGTNLSVLTGIYQQQIPNGTQEGTNYQWQINISDSSSYINETFSFRRQGWQTITTVSGTYYNRSITPIFPPPEGNGIIIENITYIKTNVSNSVIFSLDLISLPKTGKSLQLGEYFIQGEEVVAFYFSINKISNKINYSEAVITLYSPDEKLAHYQNLDLNKNITALETPIVLNASGLWKIKIDFTLEEDSIDFYVWENVKKWFPNGDKHYLTFYLDKESNLSFQNYYAKKIPVFTTSEIIGIEQGQYLKDTAMYVRDIASSQLPGIIIGALIGALGTISGIFLGHVLSQRKRGKEDS